MKQKLFYLGLIICLSNIKLYGQDLSKIESLVYAEKFEQAIKEAERLDEEFKCEKIEILAYCHKSLDDYNKSISFYEKYINECNSTFVQRVSLGDCYYKTNQLEKAKEQFLIAKKLIPNLALLDYNLGLIEYDNGNKKKAAEHFTSALNNHEGEVIDFDFVEMQIKTLNELQEYEYAFKSINKILNIWDTNSLEYKYTLIIKSSIYGAKGEFKKAIKMLDENVQSGISNESVLLEAYAYQIDFYTEINKKKKACLIYDKIREINPELEILKEYDCK